MNFNPYKFKHFYFNKYLVTPLKRDRYYLSYDYEHKALWFRTYKVASRTINNKLKAEAGDDKYIYSSGVSYVPRMFKDYFKFAFIRNPQSRFVSAWKDKILKYNYFDLDMETYEKMKNLDNFISWVETMDVDGVKCDEHLRSQNSLIDLNNLDFLGRFQNFQKDFQFVLDHLNIKDQKIETYNASKKKQIVLSENQKNRIHRIYEKDFSFFYPDN